MAKQTLIPYTHGDGKVWEYYFVDPASRRADAGGIIYFMKSHGGKKIKFSTKIREPNGLKAKAFANKEFDRRVGNKKNHVRTLISEEVDAWLAVKEAEGLDEKTMYVVKRSGRYIKEFWGDKLPSEISRDTVVEWFAWWARNKPELGMENVIKYFKNFCHYLTGKMVNDRPLLAAVPKVQDPNKRTVQIARARKKERVPTQDEFRIICETAENPDDELLVRFMATMATRIEETCSLDFDRTVILDEEIPVYRWFVGQNKADLVNQHALHPSLIEPLKALRARRRAEGTNLLFPQKRDNKRPIKPQQIDWEGWRNRSNIGWHWSAHTFRHWCLTQLFNNPDAPQAAILKLYRVSLKVALETYVKATRESMLRLRDMVQVDGGSK